MNFDRLLKYFLISLIIYSLGYAHCYFADSIARRDYKVYKRAVAEISFYSAMNRGCMKANEYYINRIMKIKRRQ